jgi:hypothetical protein
MNAAAHRIAVTDRVFIPIADVGATVLDAEAYQAALRPVSMPSSEIEAERRYSVARVEEEVQAWLAAWVERARSETTALLARAHTPRAVRNAER